MFVDGPDCRLYVETRGEGSPVTVLAHGITSSSAEVGAFSSRIRGTRVYFDFRGHGHSDSPPVEAGYGHDAMRRDLEFVADRFEATQIFGVSMGAGAAMSLLGDRHDRFERIAFFIPAAIDEARESVETFPTLADLLESKPLAEVADIVMDLPGYQPIFARRPSWRRFVRSRIMRMNATGVPRAIRAYASGDSRPLADGAVLRGVTAPALILSHEGDPIHDAAVARRLAALLPNARLRIWAEPLAMLDDIPRFSRLVGAFLNGDPLPPPDPGVLTE